MGRQLNNLSGQLDIEVRRESKYIALSEISATNLKMKENLRELDIRFKNGTKEDKRVLQCLQPPCNLKILNIDGYGGESGMPKLKGWWGMTSSEQDSKEDIQLHVQVQHQHLVNWKPAFPKLGELRVDIVELAITITMQQIPSLKKLYIWGSSIGEQSHQQQAYTLPFSSCFPNLQHLVIDRLSIKVFPEEIRYLSTLQSLGIHRFANIKEIPEWIDSLTSLQELDFLLCPRLESLPHQIVNLPNLNTFRISSCGKLREKCQSPNGEYWHLVQHIPCLKIFY
ncbi:putative disease resistance protein RGA1 [Chenopodium quinoa]|uniref:putative disease resistance protein RGA1 n=1 Tax=Chenopodium quinoa TaxID=63459 RepID=UPI000B798DC7|nr:putative disease resistance protein RGA1 [Chenopodium quinoa]